MPKDIIERKDIEQAVGRFYAKAMKDALIGHFFTTVIQLNLKKHIPVIVNFWESILLGGQNYQGNPMHKHFELNELSPINKAHFDRWLLLWKESIDELFEGAKADEAKNRAQQIAAMMHLKIKSD